MLSKGKFEVVFESKKAAQSAKSALEAESGFTRANMKISAKDNILQAEITASDVVAFRAYMNGVLRALQVFESIEEKNL
jgi:tRNA threonylcarbamoyladenosine modification (KEOPS) complex  Pcc1 subunit